MHLGPKTESTHLIFKTMGSTRRDTDSSLRAQESQGQGPNCLLIRASGRKLLLSYII